MNFYLGNSVDAVDLKETNVEFSDELIKFIYNLNKQIPFDISKLCNIDPYDDIEISKEDLTDILKICNLLLEESLLQFYDDEIEGTEMLQNLVELVRKARDKNVGLISIGD